MKQNKLSSVARLPLWLIYIQYAHCDIVCHSDLTMTGLSRESLLILWFYSYDNMMMVNLDVNLTELE